VSPEDTIEPSPEPAFDRPARPAASVLIPVHGMWPLTRQCLRGLSGCGDRHPFEVIVVDDRSPDDTAEQLSRIPGLVVVPTDRNLRFGGALNLGVESARADVVVSLNNDTVPHAGWLDALLDVLDEDPTIGLVGSMLVGTDGLVQESGGVIWADGSAQNFGRRSSPDAAECRGMRDVDYCSAAAFAVRKPIFLELGGFDPRFSPAYYEDVDLCFGVRSLGYRVVVQPESVVTHLEGGSHGTELSCGLKRFQRVNRHTFGRKWRDALVGQGLPDDPGAPWVARNRRPGGMVLIIDSVVPAPDRDAGSRRMAAIIDQLVDMGMSVHFAPHSHVPSQPYTRNLERKGVTVLVSPAEQDRFVTEAGPRLEAVMLCRPMVAWQYLDEVYQHAPDATLIFDTVDLHALRGHREASLIGDSVLSRQTDLVWARESAAIHAADVTLVVSEFERDLLAEIIPTADVRVLPTIHVPVQTAPTLDGRRRKVIFVGGYRHPPNIDAALWAATRIMPLVWRRVPDAVLQLVGPDLPPELPELAHPGIESAGWVADLAPEYASSRVAIAPLRYGAGVKGKVAEAIEHGVPLVGTRVAVEGMSLVDGVDVMVADEECRFADAIVGLLCDDVLWNSMAGQGQERLIEKFSPKIARTVLQGVLQNSSRPRRRGPLAGR
jgi:O-antigen biosynthesis protein